MASSVIANADRIRQIKTFPSLVKYLRDELSWPIVADDFEDLTYDWEPEELGIDKASAAKIDEVKQLRPLADDQPWGIFFVKFEPKQLPVVALRRLLNSMVIRKRESANKSERQAWAMNDLMFISSYGDSGERHISFAHFSQPEGKNDLPILKVLGWDNSNAPLRLDWVATKLTECLAWPDDEKDIDGWRDTWQSAFSLRHRETITTAKDLAIRLAALARAIRDRIATTLAIETDKGPLTKLMKAFQSALMHDLDAAGFADMYAQTIAYGLLSARIADPSSRTADDLTAHMKTNPFLKELMQTFLHVGGRKGKAGGPGIDFDELGVSEVVELLDDANMEAVVRDFGDKKRDEDPVMHFYESFLHEYNKQLKIQRGVFYTPQPVVSYIVRSVHELLQTEFGLADGLADITTWGEMLKIHPSMKLPPLTDEPGEKRTISPDEPFVQVLDPATGTATFLVEVIDVIHRTLAAKWKQQRLTEAQQHAKWNEYVPKHLLPRLHAFELMMAPYAIAHMKIGLKLTETGYDFLSEERARIYLTNALEPWHRQLRLPELDALAHEAAAVNEIKRHKRFTVVIGNPPYSGHSSNTSEWISGLVHDYHFVDGVPLGERNPKWLQDDYVKFIRIAQQFVGQSRTGILGYITNHSYSDNPTFRGMRRLLMRSFCSLRFVDLHGNSKKKEKSPDGSHDENVFDIQQGVAILLAHRSLKPTGSESVFHSHIWGQRTSKYSALDKSTIKTTKLDELSPTSPHYLFIPQNTNLRFEYEPFPSITEVFPINSMGVTTGEDEKFVAFNSGALKERFNDQSKVRTYAYRPFDHRALYYNPDSLARARFEFMRHMLEHENLALVTIRRPRNEKVANFFVTNELTDKCIISSLDNCQILPLYILPDAGGFRFSKEVVPNFPALFLKHFAEVLGVKQSGPHGLPAGLKPEDIFHYAYAVFHSPGYRSRYAEFLKIDFPRLPLTGGLELFRSLAKIGGELTALHLMESPKLDKSITEFIGSRNPEVEKATWSNNTVWIDKAQSIGFKGVPEYVWDFHIGGYQVCEKWLKDRKGRPLSKDDVEHYQKIVVALSETIRLMAEIDKVIDKHGGWPGAFQTGKAA
jgi:hypothetical protein